MTKIKTNQMKEPVQNDESTNNNKGDVRSESIKELVLAEYAKGNIVVSTFEGLRVAPLKEIIKQPTDGLLYDLNRNESVVLTFINDPKWINDYATVQVIRELKLQLEKDYKAVEEIHRVARKFTLAEFKIWWENQQV